MAKVVATNVKIYAESAQELTQLIDDATNLIAIDLISQDENDGTHGSVTVDINELGA